MVKWSMTVDNSIQCRMLMPSVYKSPSPLGDSTSWWW